jgi:hypothetical protein
MTDDRPLLIEAWLTGQAHREAFEDMSAAQISALPVSQYARLTGREFKITAEPVPEPALVSAPGQDPAGVMAAQHPQHATEDPGEDFQNMTMSQYEQIRGQIGIGRSASARGILG